MVTPARCGGGGSSALEEFLNEAHQAPSAINMRFRWGILTHRDRPSTAFFDELLALEEILRSMWSLLPDMASCRFCPVSALLSSALPLSYWASVNNET